MIFAVTLFYALPLAAIFSGKGLKGIGSATSLRIRDGKTETTDGPCATTKEHLRG